MPDAAPEPELTPPPISTPADRIYRLRTAQGRTQTQLAARCPREALRQAHVARAELGRHNATLATLRALATALGVDVATLVREGCPRCRAAVALDAQAGRLWCRACGWQE